MIKIEKAKLIDAQIINEIQQRAYNDETRRFGPGRDGGPDGYDCLETTKKLIKKYDFFKIVFNFNIIGGIWVRKINDLNLELEDFCIDTVYQNKGLGSKVMLLMEKEFPDIKIWSLGTPHYSVRNQYLYEKMGYKKVGKSDDGFLYLYEKRI